MTHILFLHGAPDRLAAAAHWVAANWTERRPVVLYAPHGDDGDRLDRILWTQGGTSFVPHCRADSALAVETPVLIVASLEQMIQDECLVNLSNEIPPGFSRFAEVIEVVSHDEAVRVPARERFKFYRERGYAPESRNLGGE